MSNERFSLIVSSRSTTTNFYRLTVQPYSRIPLAASAPSTLEVDPGDTIDSIRSRFQYMAGNPPLRCVLIGAGKQLENGRTLSAYDIKNKSKIYVLFVYFKSERHEKDKVRYERSKRQVG
jgi:hypothetical protein